MSDTPHAHDDTPERDLLIDILARVEHNAEMLAEIRHDQHGHDLHHGDGHDTELELDDR